MRKSERNDMGLTNLELLVEQKNVFLSNISLWELHKFGNISLVNNQRIYHNEKASDATNFVFITGTYQTKFRRKYHFTNGRPTTRDNECF